MNRTTIPLIFATAAACARAHGGEGAFHRGRVNGDAAVDLSDPVALLGYLFLGDPAPGCEDAADANDDGQLDIADGIHLLAYLFQGGSRLPPPSPQARCPGRDPTADSLGCESGAPGPPDPPRVRVHAVRPNAPGVRERSRLSLPRGTGGEYVVKEGHSFAILVVATSSPVTEARLALADPAHPSSGNPEALRVVCDGSLGDPATGGAMAGEDLGPRFFAEIDGWSDPVHLEEHGALLIAGSGPLAPAPGKYRFAASVTDSACASAEAELELEVVPSAAPQVFVWLEEGPAPVGAPLPHDRGTGNARLPDGGEGILVLEIHPNGRSGARGAVDGAPRVLANPAPAGGPELAGFLSADPRVGGRWSLHLGASGVILLAGNTELAIEAPGEPGTEPGTAMVVIEKRISYASEVQPIWDLHCTGCHEDPELEKGLELVRPGEDPERLRRRIVNVPAAEPEITSTAPLLVRPHAPEESYLFRKIEGTHLEPGVGGEGVRMPQGPGEYLSSGSLRLVRDWILQGAK